MDQEETAGYSLVEKLWGLFLHILSNERIQRFIGLGIIFTLIRVYIEGRRNN